MKTLKKIGIVFSIIFFFSANANAETLRIAGNFATDHSSSVAMKKFSDEVSKLTNGKLKVDSTYSIGNNSSGNLYIGTRNGSGSYMNGYVSDVRVINGTALYTADFTPPTAPLTAITNTKLLTCTNKNDIWDASTGNVLTKAGNATSSNTQRKFTTSSAMYFDGTGDYLNTNRTSLNPGETERT